MRRVARMLMPRREFLGLTASTLGAAVFPHARGRGRAAAGAKPNFVFVLIDDMGWTDVGCNGSTFYETPNIDRLAAEGMRFTNAYAAAPVCSPTRASILTGKSPARLNLTDWIPGRQREGGRPDEKLLGPRFAQQLPLAEVTLAEALKEAGYSTGFIGKWHLGDEAFYPEYQGFDVNVGGISYGSPPGGHFTPYRNPKLPDGPKGEYLTDRLTDEAVAFLRRNKDRPFLLYLSHYAVHNPMQSKEDLAGKYRAKGASLGTERRQVFGLEGGVERGTYRTTQCMPAWCKAWTRALDGSSTSWTAWASPTAPASSSCPTTAACLRPRARRRRTCRSAPARDGCTRAGSGSR